MTASPRQKAADRHLASAIEGMSDTFTSKAAQKRVLDHLNRAFEYNRDLLHVMVIDAANAQHPEHSPERTAFFDQNEIPFGLHQVRERHLEVIERWSPARAQTVERLIALRHEVKETPVVKPEKQSAELEQAVERVHRSIRDEMERLGAMYCEALDIGRVFNGLPVSANVHRVTNAHGTTFIRAFYYLAGKRMPLNLILAAAGTLADEKRGGL